MCIDVLTAVCVCVCSCVCYCSLFASGASPAAPSAYSPPVPSSDAAPADADWNIEEGKEKNVEQQKGNCTLYTLYNAAAGKIGYSKLNGRNQIYKQSTRIHRLGHWTERWALSSNSCRGKLTDWWGKWAQRTHIDCSSFLASTSTVASTPLRIYRGREGIAWCQDRYRRLHALKGIPMHVDSELASLHSHTNPPTHIPEEAFVLHWRCSCRQLLTLWCHHCSV